MPLSGSWSFVAPEPDCKDRIEVTGEKGRLEFSVFSFDPVRLDLEGEQETYSTIQPEHIQMPLIQSIVDELKDAGTCPSTGQTGAVTSKVMDQISSII